MGAMEVAEIVMLRERKKREILVREERRDGEEDLRGKGGTKRGILFYGQEGHKMKHCLTLLPPLLSNWTLGTSACSWPCTTSPSPFRFRLRQQPNCTSRMQQSETDRSVWFCISQESDMGGNGGMAVGFGEGVMSHTLRENCSCSHLSPLHCLPWDPPSEVRGEAEGPDGCPPGCSGRRQCRPPG